MKKQIQQSKPETELPDSKILLPEEVSEFSRRQFLRAGMCLTAYLSVPRLLLPSVAAAQAVTVQRKLVWINMSGGWDLLETVEPKQASASRLDMVYTWDQAATLAGSSEQVKIGRWLTGLASQGEDVVVVRGMAMGTTSHDAGATYMDTGILSNNGRVNAASIPAIVASASSATIPIIQLAGGMEPKTDRGITGVSAVRAENLDLYRSMYPTDADRTARRLKILDYLKNSITRAQTNTGANDRLTAISSAEAKIRTQIEGNMGAKLVLNAADRTPFTQAASAAGATGRGRSMDAFALALKLIKNDLVTSVNMGVGGFDTHSNQDRNLQPVLTDFDRNLTVFIKELRSAGKLNDTLIVLYSDFGRTPQVNGSNGRDHWPVGGAFLIGGNIEGGRAVGSTDENLLATDSGITSAADQFNPTHLGGSVLALTLGESYVSTYRSYLKSISALTRTKG